MWKSFAKESSCLFINWFERMNHHPCQALATLMTIYQETKHLKGIKLAYARWRKNVMSFILLAVQKSDCIYCGNALGYEPNEEIGKKKR